MNIALHHGHLADILPIRRQREHLSGGGGAGEEEEEEDEEVRLKGHQPGRQPTLHSAAHLQNTNTALSGEKSENHQSLFYPD